MNKNRYFSAAVVALSLALGGQSAIAHEGSSHKDGPVKKEQTPWGIAGDLKDAKRTIAIAMSDDMRFTPSSIEVMQGETVRFVVTNKGKVLHEMVIGDKKTLEAHAALMAKFPNMEHDEPYMAHVSPGKNETLVWTFNNAGDFDFACLVAGHYQAGMTGKIRVAAKAVKPVAAAANTDSADLSGEMTEGEVRKVDKDAKKITLKHGEIKSLNMPAMTMVFGVRDPALLDRVKAGDKVRFKAADEGGGKLTLVEIAR